ncbi:MAG: Rho termination factor N-terminal domain-containing protein, partial [Segetibacter sp.]|nr:Rho termination factor N-terminal domain-containing protein [Segetibacter sp.]
MYDISQLNDMLVPELQDIAEQLSIPHAPKPDKQDLIYKILDKQAVGESQSKAPTAERGKRKRIMKVNTANASEEAEVMTNTIPAPEEERKAPEDRKEDNKNKGPKRGRKPKKDEAQLELSSV